MPTIAAIAAGDARFNVLVNALSYVDSQLPGTNLLPTLSDAAVDLTVFAPTDAAFARLAADLGYTGPATDEGAVTGFLVGALPAETIRDVILYHVAAGSQTLADIEADPTVTTLNGATFTADGPTLVDNEPDLIDPALVQTDVAADNGIVHVIDRVLLPFDVPGNDAPSIAGIVAASGGTPDTNGADFDILLQAVTTAGLAGTLDGAGDFTVFAPTDAAFLRLAHGLGYSGGEDGAFAYLAESLSLLVAGGDPVPLLTDILLYHVAGESLQAAQVLANGSVATLLGPDLGLNGTTLVDADRGRPDPALIATDIQAANGVVHVIDGVLLPVDLPNFAGNPDFVVADDRANFITLGKATDRADGNGGSDTILGGSGADVILGGLGNDSLSGNSGSDTLNGDSGRDKISGGAGDDLVAGGQGDDNLTGGGGADTFVFATGSGHDTLHDFRAGKDTIDVSALGIESFRALKALIDGHGGSTVIAFDHSNSLTLEGVNLSHLSAQDFLFA
jgi:uncharacterized surface protein with fasciclin (FAS1) repeats